MTRLLAFSRFGARGSAACLVLAILAVVPAAGAGKTAGGRPSSSPSDDAVARVNGQPILGRDFDLAVQLRFSGRRPANVGLQELRAAREKVLEGLIDNELLYQSAIRGAMTISPADVEAAFKRTEERLGKAADLAKILKDNEVTEEQFKEQLRRSLIVTRFVEREVIGDLKITDDELKRYYDQNPAEFKRPERARVSQIMIRASAGALPAARAEARQRIEEILKRLRAGEGFGEMARKYSQGPESARGGDTGTIARGGGSPPPIEEAVFGLRVGEISDIVETRLGYHILKVVERKPEGPISFEDAKASIHAKLTARDREERIKAYVDGLKEKARVERYLAPAAKAK